MPGAVGAGGGGCPWFDDYEPDPRSCQPSFSPRSIVVIALTLGDGLDRAAMAAVVRQDNVKALLPRGIAGELKQKRHDVDG